MGYNWEGDVIVHNTVIKDKRFVIGSLDRQIKTDIREWISFKDNNIMKNILQELKDHRGLPSTRKAGDFDRRAMVIWDFVARNIKYVHDTEKQSKEDFWLFPPEIYTLRQGDCEDGSFLLASLLIASGISPFCVRVVLGEVFDEHSKSLGGHCWPIYKSELGQWCTLESTLDHIPSRLPEADRLAAKGQFFQYNPYYCFNNYHLWEILPEKDIGSRSSGIERYRRLRNKRVHMRNTRLPSGGWLSRMTGDWEPGHLEITGDVLEKFKFPENAIDIVGDASQDPDFYDWNTPCAHAQTNNNSEGKTTESMEQATDNHVGWIKRLTERTIKVTDKNLRSGLFLLGYTLHSIQDLATHQGLTNAQHSFLSKMFGSKNDPDHLEVNREKAAEYSSRYLDFFKGKYETIYNKLVGYEGGTLPWDKLMKWEKEKVLGKDWDLSIGAYLEYADLNKKYAKIKKENPIEKTLWDRDAVFERLMATI